MVDKRLHMSRIRRFTIGIILALSISVPLAVSAQETQAPERLAAIKTNCRTIKAELLQVQRRDLVARTNRGRGYEAVLKQMDSFQQRVRNNKLVTQPFDEALAAFKAATSAFRDAYIRYDDQLISLQQIDCQEKPDVFAAQLEEIKVMRAETAAAITDADEALAQYRQAVMTLQQQVTPTQEITQ